MTTTPTTIAPPGSPRPAAGVIDFETTREIGFYGLVWRRFKQRRVALVAAITIALLVVLCYVGPYVLPAECPDLSQTNLGPFSSGDSTGSSCAAAGAHFHLLGTDDNGRDLLLRNLSGGRVSLAIGFATTGLTILIAVVLGSIAGFFGGIVDTLVTGFTNGVLSIPSLLILIIFVKAFNPHGDATPFMSVFLIVVAISLIAWPYPARIIRSVILSTREKEFIEAARAVGTPRMRMITRHLIPNALGPIVVAASLTVGAAILTESAISFLGYGVNPPTSTWGNLLDQGRDVVTRGDAAGFFYDVWPGMLILVTVLSFNYIGDALRDAFDPRSIER